MHIPYKGTAQATTDFLGGQLDLRSFSVPLAIPLMKAGKARVLGINSLKRSPLMPEIPTVDEAGLKGFESGNWNGIMAPAGTPREIVTRLYDEITRRIIKSDVRELLIRDGYEVSGLGPEEFGAYLQVETAKWARVIKTANVKLD
jgi:tripartite-type tricarboxylate transporter receptor subunit TctC